MVSKGDIVFCYYPGTPRKLDDYDSNWWFGFKQIENIYDTGNLCILKDEDRGFINPKHVAKIPIEITKLMKYWFVDKHLRNEVIKLLKQRAFVDGI